MNLAKRKPGKGFIGLLIATIVCFAIFLVSFLLVGAFIGLSHNHQIKDFAALMQYHVDGLKGLFTFKLNDASNIIYFNLSCLLYIGIVLWVAFLIVGVINAVKRKRATIVGLVATFLSLFVFMFTATGIPQYWLIVNTRAPYDNNPALLLFTLFTIVFSLIYIVLAFVLYFVCVVDTYRIGFIDGAGHTYALQAERIEQLERLCLDMFTTIDDYCVTVEDRDRYFSRMEQLGLLRIDGLCDLGQDHLHNSTAGLLEQDNGR